MRIPILLACAAFSSPAIAQTWVLVDGGEWTPDAAAGNDVVRSVETAFTQAAHDGSEDVPPWNTYTIQYQGRVVNGLRVIEISGACGEIAQQMTRTYDLKKVFVGVSDGGPCVFRATYDMNMRRLVSFRFNGVA